MLPVIAIVGRPNVGKSTLFNCLTRSRQALVADEPGLTRDRLHGIAQAGEHRFVVVDTGGLTDASDPMSTRVSEQAFRAVDEADLALLVTDARSGLTPEDEHIASRIRSRGHAMTLVANKSEGLPPPEALSEFYRLGISNCIAISAAHRQGLSKLLEQVIEQLGELRRLPDQDDEDARIDDRAAQGLRIAVVGRPNVGKSTLVNRLCGEERVIAHDMPGTTRDSIFVPFERGSQKYTLVDTAGIRKRARVNEKIEKFSVVKAIQAIDEADVALLVLNAVDGVTDQDLSLLGHIVDCGRAVCLAVNKWDAVDRDERHLVQTGLDRRLRFIDYVRPFFVSATRGTGLGPMMKAVNRAWDSASINLPTPELTRILQDSVAKHPPPVVRGRRIKLRYAHQGGSAPPLVIVHGNQTDAMPASYTRYLSRTFREAFGLEGTPLGMQYRTSDNPYEGRRNTLTPRQQRQRKRLIKHVKRR